MKKNIFIILLFLLQCVSIGILWYVLSKCTGFFPVGYTKDPVCTSNLSLGNFYFGLVVGLIVFVTYIVMLVRKIMLDRKKADYLLGVGFIIQLSFVPAVYWLFPQDGLNLTEKIFIFVYSVILIVAILYSVIYYLVRIIKKDFRYLGFILLNIAGGLSLIPIVYTLMIIGSF